MYRHSRGGVNRMDVINLFDYDAESNKSSCKVPNCDSKLSGKVIGNMKRHILLRHPIVAKQINLLEVNMEPAGNRGLSRSVDGNDSDSSASVTDSGFGSSAKKRKLDENRFVKGCIKLCIEESVSLSLFDSEAFRMITESQAEAFDITINAASILQKISTAADTIRIKIAQELKNSLVSIKMDAATDLERGVLGINVQFLLDGILQVRTLGVMEVIPQDTGNQLRLKLERLLEEKFDIFPTQVYSVTTDSGTTMIRAVSSMDQDQRQKFESMDLDFEGITEAHDKFYSDMAQQLEANKDSTTCDCIRSVAHILQLVVSYVAGTCQFELKLVRDFVKQMKIPKFRERYDSTGTARPLLDVEARWTSTYLMVKNLNDNIEFYKDLTNDPDVDVELPKKFEEFIGRYVDAFTPLYSATTHFQEDTLAMGDFFKYWLKCIMELQKVADGEAKNSLVSITLRIMELRQAKLFENPTFLAALYMDPRFNFFGSSVLNPEHKQIARDQIFKVWLQLKRLPPSETNPSKPLNDQPSTSELDQFFQKKFHQPIVANLKVEKTDEEIKQQIFNISHQAQVSLSDSVLLSWEMRRYDDPNLYRISQVVLAVPATQVTVERAFSALELIEMARRNRHADSTIDDMLICKLNPEIFDQV